MKIPALLLLPVLLWTSRAAAQHWRPLGPDDANSASYEIIGNLPSFAVSPDGRPTVHYTEQLYYNYRGSLRIFDGTNWQFIGPRAYTPQSFGSLLTYDTSGTLYVYANYNGSPGVTRRQGQSLVPLGTLAAATSQALDGRPASLTTSLSGTPYLAYVDNGPSTASVLYVNKYSNGSWVPVGGVIAPACPQISQVTLRISRQGVPYVCYKEDYTGGSLRVKAFDGTAWNNVGTGAFASPSATDLDLTVDTSGAPVICYNDGDLTCVKRYGGASAGWTSLFQATSYGAYFHPNVEIGSDNQLYFEYHSFYSFTVKKWANAAWTDLPATGIVTQPGFYSTMQLDKLNRPYLLSDHNRLGVIRFNGSSWEACGEPGFSGFDTERFDLALSRSGQPFAVYVDPKYDTRLSVRTFSGGGWNPVGPAGFSGPTDGSTSPGIEVDTSGVPYVAYLTDDGRPAVLRYDGSSWLPVGALTQAFQPAAASNLSLAFDRVTNRPCLSFSLQPNLDVLVLRFNGSTWDTLGGGPATAFWTGASTLATDNNGQPWLACIDVLHTIAVRRLVGGSWVDAGLPIGQSAARPSLVVGGPDNRPYLCYFDSNFQPVFSSLNPGTNAWETLPSTALEPSSGRSMALALSRNGVLYAAARSDTGRAAVMRLQGASWQALPAGREVSAGWATDVSLCIDTAGYPYLAYDNEQLYARTYDGCVANPALATAACLGSTVQLVSNDGVSRSWTGPNGFSSSAQNPSFAATSAAAQSGWYRVTLTGNACTVTDSVLVTIHSNPAAPLISSATTAFCQPDTLSLTAVSAEAVHYTWSRNGAAIAGIDDSVLRVAASGSYGLRISDQHGCSAASGALTIVAHPQPQPLVSQSAGTLSTGAFAAYQWFRNGQALAGAAAGSYVPTLSGSYTVVVTDSNSCSGESAALAVTVTGNGVAETALDSVAVYPNPAQDWLHIRSDKPLQAVLYNGSGQKVRAQPALRELDLRQLPAGVYLLQLLDGQGNRVFQQRLSVVR